MPPTEKSITCLQDLIYQRCARDETNRLTSVLCNYTGASPEKRAADIAAKLHAMVNLELEVHLIDVFRKISESGDNALTGAGLIKQLRRLQSPELAQYESGKRRFAKIVKFLQTLLGEPEAKLEIPAEKDEIYVSIDSKVLPLQSLGTGIHELSFGVRHALLSFRE